MVVRGGIVLLLLLGAAALRLEAATQRADIERDLSISIWAHSVVHSTVDIYYIIKFYRRNCHKLPRSLTNSCSEVAK
jgi:predicted site-specific integrase-resolvase